ncbi:hypothetical protein ACIQC8_09225 [Agrococcus sediminis]|uniref:hypothetical protein n=1 Tax=Agrococcus sediminis TaxID=2599924 RepID=UPI003825B833
MTDTGTASAPRAPRAGRPWTALVALVLLWGAFLSVARFAVVLTLWYVATLGLPTEDPGGEAATAVALGVGVVLVLVALIAVSLRRRWARWPVVVLGAVGGVAGLGILVATASPAPETVLMSLAPLVGAVLLALPASTPWFRPRAAARPAAAPPRA